jgi:hypothetical protein
MRANHWRGKRNILKKESERTVAAVRKHVQHGVEGVGLVQTTSVCAVRMIDCSVLTLMEDRNSLRANRGVSFTQELKAAVYRPLLRVLKMQCMSMREKRLNQTMDHIHIQPG